MAITRDESRIGITPNGSLIRPFRTELPDPGTAISRGAQALGEVGMQIGERRMREETDKAATDAGNAAELVKDENGNLIRPQVPEGFGAYGRQKFDAVVDNRYVSTLYNDLQTELNVIHRNNLDNPEKGEALMRGYVEGTLEKIDPRYRGQLQPLMAREINERVRHIGMVTVSADRARELDAAKALGLDLEERIRIGVQNGAPPERIDELVRLWQMQNDRAVANGGGIKDPRVLQLEEKALRSGSTVLNLLKGEIDGGTITEDQLDAISRMLTGAAATDTSRLGITQDWIAENIPSQKQRDALASRIQTWKGQLADGINKRNTEVFYEDWFKFYGGGGRGQQRGVSPADADKLVTMWTQRNGVNMATPEGVQRVIDQFGFVPSDFVKNTFSGVNALAPDDIENRYRIYNQLARAQSVGSTGQASIGLGAMNDRDHAYMVHYDNARQGGHFPPQAKAIAEGNIARSVPKDEVARPGYLIQTFKTKTGNDNFGEKELHALYKLPSGAAFKDLPKEAQASLVNQTLSFISLYGLEPGDAVNVASQRFDRTWKRDPLSLKGWSTHQDAIAMAVGPNGRQGYDYAKPLIDGIIDPAKVRGPQGAYAGTQGGAAGRKAAVDEAAKSEFAFLPGGVRLPDDAVFKTDGTGTIRLQPQANGTALVAYISKSKDVIYLVDKNDQMIAVDMAKAARDADIFVKAQLELNANFRREFLIPDAMQAPTGTTMVEGGGGDSTGGTTLVQPRLPDITASDYIVRTVNNQGAIPPRVEKPTSSSGKAKAATLSISDGQDGRPPIGNVSVSFTDYARGAATGAVDVRVDLGRLQPELRAFATELTSEFPVKITSGFRDPKHNAAVGGAQGSQHLSGNAVDFSLKGLTLEQRGKFMDRLLSNPNLGGIGYYPDSDSIHVDFRDGDGAAWGGNKRSSSLPNTPYWFKARVMEWLRG